MWKPYSIGMWQTFSGQGSLSESNRNRLQNTNRGCRIRITVSPTDRSYFLLRSGGRDSSFQTECPVSNPGGDERDDPLRNPPFRLIWEPLLSTDRSCGIRQSESQSERQRVSLALSTATNPRAHLHCTSVSINRIILLKLGLENIHERIINWHVDIGSRGSAARPWRAVTSRLPFKTPRF
eukprot:1179085-Prorocentrum_minimum.AAC.5